MTATDFSLPGTESSSSSIREWFFVALALIASVAIRLPFWPLQRELGDALNYAIGALYSHVAHPPGSVGYCLFLGAVNGVFHDIKFTEIFVSFCAAMLAILICWRLAKAIGLGPVPALAAMCLYSFSIDTLKASLLGGPHILEGLFSLLVGWLAWKAIRGKRLSDALLASLAFAVAGALRPTTTLLLFPLWLFMLWHTLSGAGKWQRLLMHLLVVVPVIGAWNWGNNHYMTVNGYGGRTYQDQVLTTTAYDFDNMSTATATDSTEHLTFHMPGAELLACVEVKTGLRLMPHVPGWPTPSFSRAVHLMIVQTLKQGWWMEVSLPLAILLPVFIFLNRRNFRGQLFKQFFFAAWILPSIAFFIMGHLGTLTYLQVYLGGLCIWTADLLLGGTSQASYHKFARVLIIGCIILSVGFHTLSRPFQASGGIRRSLDLVLMQFDGYSIRHGFATSRRVGNTNTAEQVTGADHDYETAPNDKALLEAAWRNHFQYLPKQ